MANSLVKQFYVYVYRDRRPHKHRVPFYVGKGQGDRAYEYLKPNASCHGNKLLRNIIRAHRKLNLEPSVKIVARFATEAEAFVYEIILIAKYGRRDLGTGSLANRTDGGEGVSGWYLTLTPKQRRIFGSVRAETARRTCQVRWSDPENCRAQAELVKVMHQDPKYREALYAGNARFWSKPEHIKRQARRMKRRYRDPAYRERTRAQLEELRSDPNWRSGRSKQMSALNKDRKFQAKRRAAWEAFFKNPRLRKRRNAKISATASLRTRNANGQFVSA